MPEEKIDLKSLQVVVKGGDVEFIVTRQNGESVKFWLSVTSAKTILDEISANIDEQVREQNRNYC